MSVLFHIIKFKLISFIKFNTDLKFTSIVKNLGSGLVYILFGISVFFFTKSLLNYFLEEIKIGSFLLHRFISIIFFIFFIAVNAGNIIVSFSTLYKSKEVFYLITKPLSSTKIFMIKFLDNFFYSSTTMLLMISTVMFAYCVYFKLDFWFAGFFFFFMLLPFMLIAASLAVILLMILIRIAYKVGLKKVVFGLISAYIAGVIIFFQASNPILIVKQVMSFYPNVDSYFTSVDNPILRFLPNFWIADALYWFSKGKTYNALPYVAWLIITSLIFFFTALYAAKKMYYQNWLESFELKLKNTSSNIKTYNSKLILKRTLFTPQLDAILKKEFLQFFREPAQWIHFSIMLLLILIFIISLAGIESNLFNSYNYALRAIIYITIFSFNLFLIASLSLRFVFPSLSLEGEAYWKLKSSPLLMKKVMTIKFIILFSFILLIGQSINYFSHLNFPKPLYFISLINIGFISLAIVSLNFGMGSLFINLKEKSPIRIASSQGASLTFLFTIILIVVLIALLFIPIYNYYNDIFGFQERLKNIYISTILIALFSLIVSVVSFSLTKTALKRDL